MSKQKDISLTPTEWNLMECLWETSPRTGREAAEYMKNYAGWTRSTTLTMLRRMTEKEFICCEEGEVRRYFPAIRREEAVLQETASFVNRVYKGSVSLMISGLTEKKKLNKEEIDELYEILKKAERECVK